MTIIEKSWMTLTFFFIVLSSVKIKKNSQQFEIKSEFKQKEVSLEAPLSGALAMSMTYSMPMGMNSPYSIQAMQPLPAIPPMPMPPMPMPPVPAMHPMPFPIPLPLPLPIKIPVLDLNYRPSQSQNSPNQQTPQNPQRPSACNCQNTNQQQHFSCPPCPFAQHPQQNYPQQQYRPQSQCCQNTLQPQYSNMPCNINNNNNNYNPGCAPNNQQCVVCRPGQRPGQTKQNLVPIAQVVLTPVVNKGKKCKSDESKKSEESESEETDSESGDTDGCTRRCRKRLARMNDEQRDDRRHRRMSKRRKYESNSSDRKHKFIQPMLEYVARNGDVEYKTKISSDDAIELLGDNFVNNERTNSDSNVKVINYDEDLLRHGHYNTRKIFPADQQDIAQQNIRLMHAGDPIALRNKVQHQILNPGKKELVFQSPKGNEITNLSLTFLFS